MENASSLRRAIMSLPGWAELSGHEIAGKLGVLKRTVNIFLSNDREIGEARRKCRRRLDADILERLRRINRWERERIPVLAGKLEVPEEVLVRAMTGSVAGGQEKVGRVAEKYLEMAERIKAVPAWELKTYRVISKAVGCDPRKIYTTLKNNLALASERKCGKVLKREYLDTLKGWQKKTPQEIARDLQIGVGAVESFLKLNPDLKGRRTGRVVKKPKKWRCELVAIPGWQTLTKQAIADAMGISATTLNTELVRDAKLGELFRAQYTGPVNRWSPENIAAVESRCATVEEASEVLGVAVDYYHRRLLHLGIKGRYVRKKWPNATARARLIAVTGWQRMTNIEIGREMGVTPARISEILCFNPDLMAQRRPNFQRKRSGLADRILAIPNWQTQYGSTLSRQTGLTQNMVGVLMKCVERLAAWKGRKYDNRWKHPIQDIGGIDNWQEKSSSQLARELGRPRREVFAALMENPELFKLWVYQPKPRKKRSELYEAIQRIPNWEKLGHVEIGRLMGRSGQNIRRCIASAALLPQYHGPRTT